MYFYQNAYDFCKFRASGFVASFFLICGSKSKIPQSLGKTFVNMALQLGSDWTEINAVRDQLKTYQDQLNSCQNDIGQTSAQLERLGDCSRIFPLFLF